MRPSIDREGNDIYPGDLLLEQSGTMMTDGEIYFCYRLYEAHHCENSAGVSYIAGKKRKFYYSNLGSSLKLNKADLPKNFLHAFYNGFSSLNSTKSLRGDVAFANEETIANVKEILECSNWRRKAQRAIYRKKRSERN